MWSQAVRRCVALGAVNARRRACAPIVRQVATSSGASSTAASSAAAKMGRDIPLKIVPREARRQARLAARKGSHASVRTTSIPARISFAVLSGTIAGSLLWAFLVDASTKKKIASQLNGTFVGTWYRAAANQIAEWAKPWTDPAREKLLPDWPIPQVSPDMPPVPVLVLDLEDTLVHSEWTRKHGWRHGKRPGVDEFLDVLSQYYEIVVFSENQQYMAEEIVAKLDPNHCTLHILGREATHYVNSAHVKDLSRLNRSLHQVVIIDNDPAAYQLQPENAIPIKPYTDARNRDDHELKDLIPFLKALASERVGDFRDVLSEFRDDDGVIRNLSEKYGARVHALEMRHAQQKQKGIGGFIRGRLGSSHVPPNNQGGVGGVGGGLGGIGGMKKM